MRYKGIEIVPVERPNEPYCNSCGDSGERWKIRFCLDEVGGNTVILCNDCLQALATMSLDTQEDNSIRSMAEWIGDIFDARCSKCGNHAIDGCLPGEVGNYMVFSKFCPSCGAKMKNGNASV